MGSDTIPEVCILEYLRPEELDETKSDGKNLRKVLKAISKEQYYCSVASISELLSEVEKFGESKYRYLHLSCHGNDEELGIDDDGIRWEDLGHKIGSYLQGRRLTLSVCYGGAIKLAEPLIKQQCNSVCGPAKEIGFSEGARLWSSFFSQMFPVDVETKDHRMTQKPIIRCLASLSAKYGPPMNLFLRKGLTGMVHVPVEGTFSTTIEEYVDGLVRLYGL